MRSAVSDVLTRRGILATVLVLAFALGFLSTSSQAAEKKPNVLFVFADDQAYDTIHALGNEEIETPNLDRLVKRGTTFTHTYNQGGWHGAVCVASRTMLNTGRFLWHAEADEKRLKKDFQAQGQMWAQLMASAGYRTYFTGKWHVKADPQTVFDVARHVRPGMPNQTQAGYNRPVEGQPDKWSPYDKSFDGFWKDGKHWSEVVADDALDYLQDASSQEKPFFMYIAFNAPHDPRQSPKSYVEKYPYKNISLPQPFYPEYPYNIGSNKIRDEQLAPFPRTKYAVQVNRAEYYAIITHLDAQIGRILEALEKTGQADNTYIVFTADHGLSCGHHGLMGKQNMFDHSVRVPFMVVGPSVSSGKKIDAPIYLQDVMPTTLEWAGAKKPDHVEFQSLVPLLNGDREQNYDAIYGAYTQTQRMVTEGKDKLIVYPKINKVLLFDLEKDPLETKDLAEDPQHKATVARLMKKLQSLQKTVGDSLKVSKK
ncbi:MAG: sulfatase-like hydrolase/transferase [Planctomycetaceae bacterium]|nr:sulfatase-like hydrolase/transferase [Planctomycetaceae bacterium]